MVGDDDSIADRGSGAIPKPWRAFSFMARRVCLPFSLDWCSSKSVMILRIIWFIGSSPSF
ncbi:hypothetical protein ASD79_14515 [Caulobacter sp. Root655]|nr:hypothetical protein ASD79_14515 [Caulobacter sp. Root655]